MLEKIDLNKTIDKTLYKQEKKQLEARLAGLQQKIKELGIPIILVFEGWSASGKGTLISKVLYSLDPRNFKVHTMDKITEEMAMRPFLWPYWSKIPSKGLITIFDKSWSRLILPGSVKKWKLDSIREEEFFYDINAFEKQLTDDGALMIKLFLHISKEEQKNRFKELAKNPHTKWRLDKGDWAQNQAYETYLKLFEQILQKNNSGNSQWSIIEANDKKYATIKVLKILIHKIEEAIQKKTEPVKQLPEQVLEEVPEISILSSVNTQKEIDPKEYKKELDFYQGKISDLGYQLYAKRRSVIIAYEGWDAAGKGGNIKRITEEMDPRAYEVVPIASPTREELDHHYLWRFWTKMPKDGHMAIFDRTWYGRVLVERIEGYCGKQEWSRAYKEINDMERHMTHHGAILFKFWLHIDRDEQLRRFQARQNDPAKQYKITDEDWRNRDKWEEYEKAVNEMLFRTSTEYAPWTIVESNDKKYARIKTLKLVVKELEKQLK